MMHMVLGLGLAHLGVAVAADDAHGVVFVSHVAYQVVDEQLVVRVAVAAVRVVVPHRASLALAAARAAQLMSDFPRPI
jgi:hypothetical protein